jgi:hypothetical protein
VALSAGVEPASFRLRFTRLEGETDTRAESFSISHFLILIFHLTELILQSGLWKKMHSPYEHLENQ